MPTNQWLHGYFSKLNPLAEKIAFDMSEVISAYDHVWLTLTPAEQENILNDTIIKPEITIRYYNNSLSSSTQSSTQSRKDSDPRSNKKKATKGQKNLIYGFDRLNLCTFIQQNVGLKILHDENIGDYRDEHSFPFSYKTKSQMNLNELGICKIVSIASTPKRIPPLQVKPIQEPKAQPELKTEPEPEPEAERESVYQNQIKSPSGREEEESRNSNINKCTEPINLIAVEKLNLLSNFGSKNTLLSVSTDSNDSENDTKDQHSENSKLLPEKVQMPKGFDFLSNW
ncbi:uncharacterized protein LOC26527560 [Drosophila mojavensis]|uniref:DUF4706 domain-containing protein n=1 Tax=Drosophila mojavensis TaxID=7230 RepID=A0A0Q9XJ02_DROMO|nr:uncharacterized protein LOC26527560 [Drosophila mojavensis]KRG04878.1 uncharacterized protein Dmoj_GI25919 [Drosophila mojavensis]